jgi:hypothetical protein
MQVGVTLREDNRRNLYYNHNPIEEAASSQLRDTAHKAGAGRKGTAYDHL